MFTDEESSSRFVGCEDIQFPYERYAVQNLIGFSANTYLVGERIVNGN